MNRNTVCSTPAEKVNKFRDIIVTTSWNYGIKHEEVGRYTPHLRLIRTKKVLLGQEISYKD
jgi:hypothetical protein